MDSSVANRLLSGIKRWFIFNRLYITISAMVNVVSVSLILGSPLHIVDAVIVALVTTGIYQWNRTSDSTEDAVNAPDEARIAAEHHTRIRLYCLAVFVASIILAAITGGWTSLAFVTAGITLGFLYNQSSVLGIPIHRLKHIFLVKNLAVAFGLCLGILIFPSIHSGYPFNAPFLVVFVYLFINLVMLGIITDVRDYAGDQQAHIRTLPTVMGIARTQNIIHILNGVSLVWVTGAVLVGAVPAIWLLIGVENLVIFIWTRYLTNKMAAHRMWSYALVLLDTGLALVFGLIVSLFRSL